MKKFSTDDILGSKLCGVISLVQEAPAHGSKHISRLSWNRSPGPQSMPDEGLASHVVELSIGQHEPDPCVPRSILDLLEQAPIFVPVTSSCTPRLHHPPIQFDHDQSSQSKLPTQEFRATTWYELLPDISGKNLFITTVGPKWFCLSPADDQRNGDFHGS